MKKLILTVLIFILAVGVSMAAKDRVGKSYHKEFNKDCIQCHGEKAPKEVTKLLCAECHGSAEDMKAQTAGLGNQNPHTSIHFGTTLPCEECHKEHRPSYNYCTEACHRNWENKIPQ